MRTAPPPLLTIADLPRYARPDRRLELVDGHLFVSALDTPYLEALTARAAHLLRDAGAEMGGCRVLVNEVMPIDDRNLLIPDVAVVARDGARRLVVELRSDSTVRYALGPKRMVYGRAHVPEYWYVDPRAATVSVLRRAPDDADFGWPPQVCAGNDPVVAAALTHPIAAWEFFVH